tara:strand:+ start:2759 stop:3304 length:546 start_codon:yes stop_codon:yes gene_type:complete
MGGIDKIKYSMDRAKFITIGYTYRCERKLYEFLKDYNTIYINDNNNNPNLIQDSDITNKFDNIITDIKSLKRNKIIDNVIGDNISDIEEEEIYYIINLNNIITPRRRISAHVVSLNTFIQNLQRDVCDMDIKIILLASTYKSVIEDRFSIRGGSAPIYASDLVLSYDDVGDLKIIKSRYVY